MYKKIIITAAISLSSSVMAFDYNQDSLSELMKGNSEVSSDWHESNSKQDFIEKHKVIQKRLNSRITLEERDSLYSIFIDTVKSTFHEASDYWDESTTYYNRKIFMSEDLVDMDRMNFITSYDETKQKNYMTYYNENKSSNFDTSSLRMKKGLPPIGTDGMNVQICSLFEAPNAPYFEIDFTTADIIDQLTGDVDCKGDYHKEWWKFRQDFINKKFYK